MSARTKVLWCCLLVVLLAVAWRWGIWFEANRHKVTPGVGPEGRRPNILLISLDTVRPDHLGCYGYALPTSPNLDRFAQSAVRFSQARTQAPWTTPSHMSLFTSMLPSSHGVEVLPGGPMSPRIPTLAQILEVHKYQTVGVVNNAGVESVWGFNRGFEHYEEKDFASEEGACKAISKRAKQWLDNLHNSSQPWFLFVHYFDAHDPYRAPESLRKRFNGVSMDEAGQLLDKHVRPEQPFEYSDDLRKLMASYDAGIAYLDSGLGELLNSVPPNTLVIVFSDHGEGFKEHGWLWHGSTLYEEETHCALFMRLPNQESAPPGSPGTPGSPGSPGRVIDEPVQLMDVAPTLLGYLGIAAPPGFEGRDLSPLLLSPANSGNDAAPAGEAGNGSDTRLIIAETKMAKHGRLLKSISLPPWKMIYNLATGEEELYKLPNESDNLIYRDSAMAQALQLPMQQLVKREHYWMIYCTGDGEYQFHITAAEGDIKGAIVLNMPVVESNHFDIKAEQAEAGIDAGGKRHLYWTTHPGHGVQAAYIQTSPVNVPLKIECLINGHPAPDRVFAGRNNKPVTANPSEIWIGSPGLAPPPRFDAGPRLSLGPDELLPPMVTQSFQPVEPGVYIRRFGDEEQPPDLSAPLPVLDAQQIDLLKSQGYLR